MDEATSWDIGPIPIALTALAAGLLAYRAATRRRGESIALSSIAISVFIGSLISYWLITSKILIYMIFVSDAVSAPVVLLMVKLRSTLGVSYASLEKRELERLQKSVAIGIVTIFVITAVVFLLPPSHQIECFSSARCRTAEQLFGSARSGFSIIYIATLLSMMFFWLLLLNAAELFRRQRLS